jgi:uncharacterized protein (TIGR03435 family)
MQERDAWVLRPVSGAKPLAASTSAESTFMSMRGKSVAKRQPMSQLVDWLANQLRAPVVDETGLGAKYDWELPYQSGQLNVALDALRDRLGLEVVKARRPIRVLVVEGEGTQPRR